jgi:hypothetical protein
MKKLMIIFLALLLCGGVVLIVINHHESERTSAIVKNRRFEGNAIRKKYVTNLVPPSEVRNGNIVINTHGIEGYTDKLSYYPGETIQFKVHAPDSLFSIIFKRFGKSEEEVGSISNIQGFSQNYSPSAYQTGANWKTTYEYKIPPNWRSGLYAAELSDSKGKFNVTFLIKNRQPEPKDIAVLSSTNTWEAYNDWGGKSLYSFQKISHITIYQHIVSFQRPNPGADPTGNTKHLASGEKYILGWLESKGYHYDMLADSDLSSNAKVLDPFKILIISTHSEYWTLEMYNNVKSFLNRGGTVLYLSGNGMSWHAALKNDQIEVMKNGGFLTLEKGRGGRFSDIGLSESSILGVKYRSTGFAYPAPYRVINPNHWIFANTGLKKGDLIGEKGLNTVNNSLGGASGWETDQMDRFSPKNTVLLAVGINKGQKGADMTYYDTLKGGGVFAAGSITFGGSLAIDPKLSQMVQNVIDRFNK